MAGVLVQHAAEVLALVVQTIDGSELLLQPRCTTRVTPAGTVRFDAPIGVANELRTARGTILPDLLTTRRPGGANTLPVTRRSVA